MCRLCRETNAYDHLNEVVSRYDYDMTGQDGEEEIRAAAEGYTDTQNDRIKHDDPERYAEMRAFGQL